MGSRLRLLIAAATVAGSSTAARAQTPAPVAPEIGQRIRITAPSHGREPIVGIVDSLRDSAVVVDTAHRERRWFFDPGPILTDDYRRVIIPFGDIRALEVSRGRSRSKGAMRGAIIGGVVGALTWGFANTPQFNPGWADFKDGLVPGLAIGAPAGALFGYLWGREKWRPVVGPFLPKRR